MPTSSSERAVVEAPVLTPQLLGRMHQLNLEYLQLLIDTPAHGTCVHADAMPATLRQPLAQLSPPAMQLLAAAPYALYTLGFDDQELWLAQLSGDTLPLQQVAEAPAMCRHARHIAFCETVIFFAWHVAVANRLAARMLLGMPAVVGEQLQAAPFVRLQQLMRASPWLLRPRWPANPRFWPDLVKAAGFGDAALVRECQLLGSQLIATELRLAESPPPEIQGRLRAARQQQLRELRARR